MLIGQDKLIAQLSNYTLETFPHTTLFCGQKGCGKHTLIKELSNKFNILLLDITKELNNDYISEIYINPISVMYIIDCDDIDIRQQNILLKILEEPLNNIYLVLLSSNDESLLPTVVNRCVKFKFENYTKEILSNFVKDVDINILEYCDTPGQLVNLNTKIFTELNNLCDKIVSHISVANYANTLSIANKINYKDEYDKYDLMLFFKVLCKKFYIDYRDNNNILSLKLYNIMNDIYKDFLNSRLNKEYLVENMLSKLWKESHQWRG